MDDVFRKVYAPLTDKQKAQGLEIKEKAEELLALFNQAVPQEERSERSRCMAIARTDLEKSVMMAVKGVYTEQK